MGSQRLPGKVLMSLGGKPLLQRCLERAMVSSHVRRVIVATTRLPEDDCIVALVQSIGCPCFRGSDADVLDRYYQCAKEVGAENIVRLTGDNPLIQPAIIDRTVELFLDTSLDYACNRRPRSFPLGFDVEVFNFKSLETAWREARHPDWREHVTPYIIQNPGKFLLGSVVADEDQSGYRLTVDTLEDYLLCCEIYKRPELLTDCHLLLQFLRDNPKIAGLNAHIPQVQVSARES